MLNTHITGAEVHGKQAFMLIDIHQWPHDANLTMNSLLFTLSKQASENRFTKHLHVQLDNCGRENKVHGII